MAQMGSVSGRCCTLGVFFKEIVILNYSKVLFWLLPEKSLPDHALLRNETSKNCF